MKFIGFKSNREVNVTVNKYLIDWDHAVSKPQKLVKDFLRPYWGTKVVLEEFKVPGPGCRLRVDLMNLTDHIAVEVSPKGSHSYNPFFHGGSRHKFGSAMKRDLDKQTWLERNGFTYVELTDDDFDKLSPEWFEATYSITL